MCGFPRSEEIQTERTTRKPIGLLIAGSTAVATQSLLQGCTSGRASG
jgi:hypothetical protein